MEPYLTIIIPVYNAECYISECVHSLLMQSYHNFEILLINDGSTDRSLSVCEELSKKDKRIRVIDKKNGGVASARNLGIQFAKGVYIQFIDSDDTVSPDICKIFIEAVDMYPDKVVLPVCGIDKQEREGGSYAKIFSLINTRGLTSSDIYAKELVAYKTNVFFGSPDNKLYRKNILWEHKITFEEGEEIGEDFVFNMKYLRQIDLIVVIPECCYHYRYNAGSLTKKKRNAKTVWERERIMYQEFCTSLKCLTGNEKTYNQERFLLCSIKKVLISLISEKKKYQYQIWNQILNNACLKSHLLADINKRYGQYSYMERFLLYCLKSDKKFFLYLLGKLYCMKKCMEGR